MVFHPVLAGVLAERSFKLSLLLNVLFCDFI